MTLYLVDMYVKSPLIIVDMYIGNVFKHKLNYIPPQTLRGSILSKLIIDYKVDQAVEISGEDTVVFHPLYPVVDGSEARPSYIFLYECKLCEGEVYISDIILNSEKLKNFKYENYEIPYKCRNNHLFLTKPVDGNIIFNGKKYKKVYVKYVQLESIGLFRGLGRTELGMLYSYIGVAPGTRFKGLIYDAKDKLKELVKGCVMDGEYRIGRGISRGMGIVEMNFKEINEANYIEERSKEIKELIEKTDLIMLRALTPILFMEKGKFSYDLDLSHMQIEKLNVFRDKNYIPKGLTTLRGFSLKTGLPKVSISGLAPGTLYFYMVTSKCDVDDLAMKLAKYELTGFSKWSYMGLNIMEVLTDVKHLYG